VTVNSQPTTRHGTYFHGEPEILNTGGHVYQGITNLAVLNLRKSYLWGLDHAGRLADGDGNTGGIGGLAMVADYSGSVSRHFPCYDGNGNVSALVNAADGTVSVRYEYGPFGELIRATGPMASANPFRFSTKFTDDETDLVCYGYRYYSTSLGRWLSRDPLEEDGGMNLYGFVGNNPNNRIDAFGLWGEDIHHVATARWARQSDFIDVSAEDIGMKDDAVDGLRSGTGPWTYIGDQSYHFNRNYGGGRDSTLDHYKNHLKKTKEACSAANDDPSTAVNELGRAFHPLQDWVAHCDYGFDQPNTVTKVHNDHSSQTEFGLPTWKYADDPLLDALTPDGRPTKKVLKPNLTPSGTFYYTIYVRGNMRFITTMNKTKAGLSEFLSYVKQSSKSCGQCQK
jgi:RHS repeat-associated protein